MAGGIRRIITLVLDRNSAKQAGADMERQLQHSGERGGKDFFRALKAQFERETAQTKLLLAKGLITPQEAAQRGQAAAKAYNTGMARGMDDARLRGELTDREFTKLGRTLKNVGDVGHKSGGLIASTFGKLGALFGVTLAIEGVRRFATDIVKLGIDGAETASKFDTTFGSARASMDNFIESFRTLAGMSRNEAKEFTATTGAMARGMGYTEDAAAELAQQVAMTAGDLTSFNNVPIAETSRAIRSALTGERESLKTLGIVVMEADVQQRAMARSGKENAAALTQQEKAAATLELIQERMGPAAGDLERTQTSLANQTRRAAAAWRTLKEDMGAALADAGSGTTVIDSVTDSVDDLTLGLNANREAVSFWANLVGQTLQAITRTLWTPVRIVFNVGQSIGDLIGFILAQLAGVVTEGINLLARGANLAIEQLNKLPGIDIDFRIGQLDASVFWDEAAGRLDSVWKQMTDVHDATDKLAQSWVDVAVAATTAANAQYRASGGRGRLPGTAPGGGSGGGSSGATTGGGTSLSIPHVGAAITPIGGINLGDPIRDVVPLHETAAEKVRSTWTDALHAIADEGSAIQGIFGALGDALVNGTLKDFPKLAIAKVKENIARAIENAAMAWTAGALGRPDAATAFSFAAKTHVAAAGAWGAMGSIGAITAGGTTSGGGGGGGFRGSDVGNIGGRFADRARPGGNSTIIHITMDPLAPTDARLQRTVRGALEYANERYGSMEDGVQINANGAKIVGGRITSAADPRVTPDRGGAG